MATSRIEHDGPEAGIFKCGQLFRRNDLVVLVTDVHPESFEGVIIAATHESTHGIGYHADDWKPEDFEPFHGCVIMEEK